MEWTKVFYTRQYELLESPIIWATFSPDNLPERAINRAAAVERLAGLGTKHVLELGCGGGIMATAIALRGNRVIVVDLVDAAVANARRLSTQLKKGSLTVVQGDFYEIALEDKFDVVCYFDGFGIGGIDRLRRHALVRPSALNHGNDRLAVLVCQHELRAEEVGPAKLASARVHSMARAAGHRVDRLPALDRRRIARRPLLLGEGRRTAPLPPRSRRRATACRWLAAWHGRLQRHSSRAGCESDYDGHDQAVADVHTSPRPRYLLSQVHGSSIPRRTAIVTATCTSLQDGMQLAKSRPGHGRTPAG